MSEFCKSHVDTSLLRDQSTISIKRKTIKYANKGLNSHLPIVVYSYNRMFYAYI